MTNGRISRRGSLNWAIGQCNANPGSTIVFAIPRSDSRYDASRGVWRIRITSTLPAITGAGTLIDGTTQATNVGDDNFGYLGTGGTVGVDGLILPQVAAPEIEIVDARGLAIGLDVAATDVTIRGLAIYGFGTASNSDGSADIRVRNVSGAIFEQCVLSTPADSFSDPGGGARSVGDHVRVVNEDNGVLRDNLIGYSQGKDLEFNGGVNGWRVEGNEFRRNGIGNANLDAIDIENGSGSIVDRNVIRANVGTGIAVTSGSGANLLTRNSIDGNGPGNGQTGIDLLAPGDNQSLGTAPYVTLNDPGDGGGNGLLNFAVLVGATLSGSQLVLSGYARPGSALEVYVAAPDPSGFGEGQTYVVTLTEGSGADQDSETGTYTSPVNGLNVGTDTTNLFRFSLLAPPGADLTYTVTFTNGGGSATYNIVLGDLVPVQLDFKLGSPFANLGATGLTASVQYSDDDGRSWTLSPTSGGGGAPTGCDRNVTDLRWVFTGVLSNAAASNQGNVGFTGRIR